MRCLENHDCRSFTVSISVRHHFDSKQTGSNSSTVGAVMAGCKPLNSGRCVGCGASGLVSIRAVFVLVCVVQVTLCAAICAYLGYNNAVKVTSRLSSTILDYRFRGFQKTIDGVLAPLVDATDSLQADFAPIAPGIMQTGIARYTPSIWHVANRRFRRRLALGRLVRESYACALGNVSMSFIPQAESQTLIITDATTNGSAFVLQLNVSSLRQDDWSNIQADFPLNATFDSLLQSDKVIRTAVIPLPVATRSWYQETVAGGVHAVWTLPFKSVSTTSVIFGNGKGIILPGDTKPSAICVAQIPLSELRDELLQLDFGRTSHFLLLQDTGLVLVTSFAELHDMQMQEPDGRLWLQNHTAPADGVDWVGVVLPLLLEWGLVTPQVGIRPASNPTFTLFHRSLRVDGTEYFLRSSYVQTPGLRAVLVTLSLASDFDSGAADLLTFTTLTLVLVLLASIALTLVVVKIVWRRVDEVVEFMRQLEHGPYWTNAAGIKRNESSRVVTGGPTATAHENPSMEHIEELVQRWDRVVQRSSSARGASSLDSGPALASPAAKPNSWISFQFHASPKSRDTIQAGPVELMERKQQEVVLDVDTLQPSNAIAAKTTPENELGLLISGASHAAASVADDASHRREIAVRNMVPSDKGDPVDSRDIEPGRRTTCELSEPALMRRTFGRMLHSLYDFKKETDRANQAKRHFIRYIFHEVRVPFNAVSLCKWLSIQMWWQYQCIKLILGVRMRYQVWRLSRNTWTRQTAPLIRRMS